MTPTAIADLGAARDAVEIGERTFKRALSHLAANGGPDVLQVVAYDLSHIGAALATARSMLAYAEKGEAELRLSCVFIADALSDVASRFIGRYEQFGIASNDLDDAMGFLSAFRDPTVMAELCGESGPSHLDADFELVASTFKKFAENEIAPHADEVHRNNLDVPESIIEGLAAIGGFGLSVPEEYGGFATGGEGDYLAMLVATEELSRASIGIGGSLFTRPEILTRALLFGGTEEQKKRFLPKVASGELLAAVAVTEPDFGSDVASIVTSATRVDGGWVINGTKTWCTFAARADALMLLARTDPDRTKSHKGLSMFVVEKERCDGHGFVLTQGGGGRLEGRPIDTLGYRGMHSYELSLSNWFVPDENLIGGEEGLGRGFYFQMQGFENGRLQTAARAVGLMQAAYDAAFAYAENRVVFTNRVIDYELTKVKLTKMAAIIQASRQYSYEVARLMGAGKGLLEASMIKAYVCRAAEWVTREAMQIHGGMGYAEEYPVSRYFVDARVLSIFEGADETLALKVIARRLLDAAG